MVINAKGCLTLYVWNWSIIYVENFFTKIIYNKAVYTATTVMQYSIFLIVHVQWAKLGSTAMIIIAYHFY